MLTENAPKLLEQGAPEPLQRSLSTRLSGFLPHSVNAKAGKKFWVTLYHASAYTEYTPKPLYCMLRARRSCFGAHSEGASAASAHAQCMPKLCN